MQVKMHNLINKQIMAITIKSVKQLCDVEVVYLNAQLVTKVVRAHHALCALSEKIAHHPNLRFTEDGADMTDDVRTVFDFTSSLLSAFDPDTVPEPMYIIEHQEQPCAIEAD